MKSDSILPLDDIKVLDFSFHLPGPMASLILVECGARVIKVERPGTGDELRLFPPTKCGESLGFAMLNAGKQSISLDLKSPDAVKRLAPLIQEADVIIEQFRPGVMDRLGLGYEQVSHLNPSVIYCSITGYGQTGPARLKPGHDLNYCAEAGLLSLTTTSDGSPQVPSFTVADIAGGAYPAVMSIFAALRRRDRFGMGAHLDISMSSNLFPLIYWAIAEVEATGESPKPSGAMLTGGSPRYAIYRASDGRYIAAAPLEDRFWNRFCDRIGLPEELRADDADPEATKNGIAAILATRPAREWEDLIGDECCCAIVATLEEALQNSQFRAAGLFAARSCTPKGQKITALPIPIARGLTRQDESRRAPAIGEDNERLLGS